MLGVDGRSGVAFFLGIVPVGLVAGEFQVQLPGLHFGFLQAHEVCVQLHENIRKALARHSPEAVYVPAYEFQILHFAQNDS